MFCRENLLRIIAGNRETPRFSGQIHEFSAQRVKFFSSFYPGFLHHLL